jgi:hypothetical protein
MAAKKCSCIFGIPAIHGGEKAATGVPVPVVRRLLLPVGEGESSFAPRSGHMVAGTR